MKPHPHFFQKFFSSPLLLRPDTAGVMQRDLLQLLKSGSPLLFDARLPQSDAKPASRTEIATRRMNAIMENVGDTAVVHIEGVIDKGLPEWCLDYGYSDLEDVDNALSAIAAQRGMISTVVLHFDTPGGVATGVSETANRIAALRDDFEVHSFVRNQCCSAGYWMASQADKIVGAPSVTIGSIGVYMALVDQSEYLQELGIKVNLLKAGKYKAMGASFKPLEPEERAIFQQSVDALYKEFTAAVSGQRDLDNEVMQGQCFSGKEGAANGLMDALTEDSLDEYVADLLSY